MIRDSLLKAVLGLLVFLAVMAALGLMFEEEMLAFTDWVVRRIGFLGMCLILLVTDTLVTPFPPDVLLLVIAKTQLVEHWPRYVTILALVSVCAGLLGWSIGRWLGHFAFAQRMFGDFREEHRNFIRRYGFWAVAIGSITPLPFSVTCWGAGALGLRGRTVAAAALLFRIPRFFLYYWLITTTGKLFG
ncbi:MAG: YqaA family protein [Rhodocyclaceae bacterium]